MTITYGLMEKYEDICKADPSRARILVKSKVTELLSDDKGNVTGVRVQDRDGKVTQEMGQVIIATGGFGADFTDNSYLK